MRNLLLTLSILALMGCGGGETAQADIKLSTMQCGMCKSTIENGLSKVDGIVKVNVDVETKVGHVTYKASMVDLPGIEKAIASLGYDANDTKSDPEAYSKLDACCKIPGGH